MNNKIDQVLRYIINEYPYPHELSKTRTTKLVYLVDWLMAKKYGKQLTDINWYFDHFGPFVSDVFDAADEDRDISIKRHTSNFGTVKYIVVPKNMDVPLEVNLSPHEIKIIDEVIEETEKLYWNDFIDYVYSTYPISKGKKYGNLDLVKLAEEEKVQEVP